MNISALIPARISSKRLPEKNIKRLGGKPLLFWSIDAALEADVFNQIYVSTESETVAALVDDNYPRSAVRVFRRPERLATDQASLNDVCTHLLERCPDIDVLSLMMPTYPFRSAQRIVDEIMPPLFSRQIDRVESVRYGNYSTFDYWIHSSEQSYKRMYSHNPLWCGAGSAAYSFQKRDYFFLPPQKWPTLFGEKTLRIQTNYLESIDIDTPADFIDAERICAGDRPQQKRLTVGDGDAIDFVAPRGADVASFLDFIGAKGIRTDLPVLILRPADPLFTFLRWYECNSTRAYTTEETNRLIANLPASGHSQDFPVHYIHSPCYRVLRKKQDVSGMLDDHVPSSQVIFETDLKREWPSYIEPVEWVAKPEG